METMDITVGEPAVPSILQILSNIRPGWDSNKLIIKELDGGYCNKLYYCGLMHDTEAHDVLLVKVYGAGAGDWIDRDLEVTSMFIAHSVGLASPLYYRFQNGIAYKYYKGNIPNFRHFTNETFFRGVARKLAILHNLDPNKAMAGLGGSAKLNKVPTINIFLERAEKWSLLPALSNSYEDPFKERIRLTEFAMQADDIALLQVYSKELEEMGFPTCFCHSDPHATNIIYEPKTGEIHLIDWELSGIDYAVHDIGWYFAGSIVTDDGSKFYPDKNHQLKWIRWYLEYSADLRGEGYDTITEADINKLYKGSVICGLMRSIIIVVFFRLQDSVTPSNPELFRKARQFQRLVRLIKNEHYQSELCL